MLPKVFEKMISVGKRSSSFCFSKGSFYAIESLMFSTSYDEDNILYVFYQDNLQAKWS